MMEGSCPAPITVDVDGRVVDSWGGPLAGVLVHVGGAVATTDASGGFRFETRTLTLAP